jgi:molybdenum cofactor cytidylyltransferase
MPPQQATHPSPQAPLRHALVMAAGCGSRLGGQAKGLLSLHGTPLLLRHVQHLQAAGLQATVLLGYQHAEVAQALAGQAAHGLVCPHWQQGLSASVLFGLQHLPHGQDVLVSLVDMPWLETQHLQHIQHGWAQRPAGMQALVPCHRAQRGHPVVVGSHWAAQCRQRGVAPRQLMDEQPQHVWFYPVEDPAFVRDVDTPADWAACQQALVPAQPGTPPKPPQRTHPH